ncbi:MAG: hypothetical protein IJZ23_03305 [Roseburia sp.]|nr:hypothetical protein [Roseburia sp.]
MNEKLVIVPRKISGKKKMLNIGLFVLACVLLLLATFIAPYLFFIPGLLVAALWIWLGFFSNVEYEYTYFDGDLRMAKITNKSRRKNLVDVSMEDVLTIAPKGDRSIYKYENDNNCKYKDLTSGEASAKVYALVFKSEKGTCRYEFEPDEEMLNAIMVKYPRLVVK